MLRPNRNLGLDRSPPPTLGMATLPRTREPQPSQGAGPAPDEPSAQQLSRLTPQYLDGPVQRVHYLPDSESEEVGAHQQAHRGIQLPGLQGLMGEHRARSPQAWPQAQGEQPALTFLHSFFSSFLVKTVCTHQILVNMEP